MAKPRILISYWFGDRTIPLGEAMAEGFAEIGFDVECFNTWTESSTYRYLLKPASRIARGFGFKSVDFSRNSRWGREQYRQNKFRQMALDFKPDILLVIHGHVIDNATLEALKSVNPGLLTLGWWVENPRDDNRPLLAQALLYDHYFCIHQYNYDPASTEIRHFQALAVDRKRYHKMQPPLERTKEIVFVGSWYPKREQFLAAIADLPLSIYGPIWEKKCKNPALLKCLKGRSIWGQALLDLYNRAQIVINVSIWDSHRETLNLRIMDVPATGALLLTDDSAALREFFIPGMEVATFNTAEDLRKQVLHYLAHPDERKQIAEAGYLRTEVQGSYAYKARALLNLAGYDFLMPASTGSEEE